MKFLVRDTSSDQKFVLVYRADEYSFGIEPHISGFTSILINDLQLEIDDDGTLMYVWGLCPLINCKETSEFPAKYESHTLVALLDQPPTPGISIRLNKNERWPLFISQTQGWVCLGDPKTKGDQMVEFAPKCVAVLENQEMRAVWLQPQWLP